MTERNEPSASARQIAFSILTRHPDCVQDDVSLNDLIDDIAAAIDAALTLREKT
jgi:hypothetical protein